MWTRIVLVSGLASLLFMSGAAAQGPGSCGFHLDIIADLTSTHSAIADAPYAPGGGFFPYLPGAAGNPYQAYATPGTTVTLRVTIPASTLGALPIGAGSTISILYSVGTPFLPLAPLPPLILPPCIPGEPIVLVVLPTAGAIVDGIGIVGPPPLTPPVDPGHPLELEETVLFPALPIGLPVHFQAVAITPGGLIGISNGVSLLAGPNPAEVSLLPAMAACGLFPALDEGFALIPTPPFFTFYGVPQPAAQVITNGFVEFAPFGVTPVACDILGTPPDLGCFPPSATSSPRISVNHYDADFTLFPPFPLIADITLEIAPPMPPAIPTRHIIRWKHAPEFGAVLPFPDGNRASHVVELWGDDNFVPPIPVPGASGVPPVLVDGKNRVVAIRQDIHMVTVGPATHAQMGIGPGPAAAFCTPMPFWMLYGFPPYLAAPGEAVHMDPASMGAAYPLDSTTMTNLALVCDPPVFVFPPISYAVQVY